MEKLKLDTPNRATARDRRQMHILYTRDCAEVFKGASIPGMCVSKLATSTKNGKWSTTTYDVVLAEGVKSKHVIQDWDTGRFINDISSMSAMQKELGLDGLSPAAFRDFLSREMPATLERHEHYMRELDALESAGEQAPVLYEFNNVFLSSKQGHVHLLIDGEVWNERYNPLPGKVVVQSAQHVSGRGGGSSYYKLLIAQGCHIEELQESAYGGDALDTRGYAFDGEKWTKKEPETAADTLGDWGDALAKLKNKMQ